jgi:hypothetical protein
LIPLGIDAITEWADDTCEELLDYRVASCGSSFDYFSEYDASNRLMALYEANTHTGPVYFQDGGCVQQDLTDILGDFFSVGDAVPLDSFPAIELVEE